MRISPKSHTHSYSVGIRTLGFCFSQPAMLSICHVIYEIGPTVCLVWCLPEEKNLAYVPWHVFRPRDISAYSYTTFLLLGYLCSYT